MKARIGLLTAVIALPFNPALADVCSDVAAVTASAYDLSLLRGNRIGDGVWSAKASITGFDACEIETYKDSLIFKCEKQVTGGRAGR
jgi:hypothetical protein